MKLDIERCKNGWLVILRGDRVEEIGSWVFKSTKCLTDWIPANFYLDTEDCYECKTCNVKFTVLKGDLKPCPGCQGTDVGKI